MYNIAKITYVLGYINFYNNFHVTFYNNLLFKIMYHITYASIKKYSFQLCSDRKLSSVASRAY